MSQLRVNIISESAFTTQGHGVHTAFVETVDGLKALGNIRVAANDRKKADVVHIHTVGPYSLRYLLFASGVKVVSAHVTPDSFVGSLIGAKYWYGIAKWYLRWFYNRADAVLAVSGEVEHELKTMGVHKPIYLVPNTINTKQFHYTQAERTAARAALGIKPDQKLVIGVGQVQPRKGMDSFAAAAKALPDTRFIWVGGMPFKRLAAAHAGMERLMRRHPANLSFTGVINHEEVIAYYRAADVFFLPSHQETFGIVIVEAAAASLPVLVRDLDQYRQTFNQEHYLTGTDNAEFIKQLKRLVQDEPYRKKAVRASKAIAEQYDSARGAESLVEIYQEIIQSRKV